jgi:leucyl-tRNA synthetase
VSTDSYVFATCPPVGGDLDPTRMRGYAIADAQARFRRARGDDVLFTIGFDTFATAVKPGEGQSAGEWLDARRDTLRRQLDGLAISLDWERALSTDDPDVYRWSQWLFAKLLEAGLVYQRGGKGWFLQTGGFNEENDRRLEELTGWSDAARAAQRKLLARIDGFELEATALDGTALTLFTPHPDAAGSAEFVGFSTQRPELEQWLGDPELRRQLDELRRGDWADKPVAELPSLQIGMSAQVPGVAQPLPILVSPSIDARFGPAAILGVPSADPADKALAKGLPKAGGLAWKVDAKAAKPSPAVRFFAEDMPVSRGRAWGAPVPAVHCHQCGTVAVPLDQLPLKPPADLDVKSRGNPLAERADFIDCECPRCGAAAKRDPGTIHPRLGAAWIELALAVPAGERAESMFDHAELRRWLPTAQTVEPPDAGVALLDMRTVAKALRDAGAEAVPADGEPHGSTLIHESFSFDAAPTGQAGSADANGAGQEARPATGQQLIDAHGADVLRFALLHAAAPTKSFGGGEDALRHSTAFLDELRAFAEPRLDGAEPGARIDLDDGLRRRLAGWCDTAVARTAENYERLDLHRATRNVKQLLTRIQDFEERVNDHRSEVAGPDREAGAIALTVLVQLLAPLAPQLAEQLWARTGAEGPVGEAAWPSLQREPAPA